MASSTSSILTRFFVFCNGIYHYSTIVVSVVILRFPECMSIGDDLPGIIMIDFIFISPVMPRWVQLKGEWKHSHFMCFYFTMHHHHITCILILPCITIILLVFSFCHASPSYYLYFHFAMHHHHMICALFFLQYITIISDVFLFYHASPSYYLYFHFAMHHHHMICGFFLPCITMGFFFFTIHHHHIRCVFILPCITII